MGTRHLIAVHLDGEYKVAQYGQWDGCPGSQGADILAFIKLHNDETFVERVRQCQFATDEEVNETWKEFGVEVNADNGFVSYDIAKTHDEKYPTLSRDTGANVLPLIKLGEGKVLLRDSIEFAGDSLFCEWAYVIDLDKNTFEVYKGFNKSPLNEGERFKALEALNDAEKTTKHREYFPVKLEAKWYLDELPTEAEFITTFNEEEE